MLATTTPRCHRCLEPMTLFVVGDDYCAACRRDMKVREDADRRRSQFKLIHPGARAKEMWPRGAA